MDERDCSIDRGGVCALDRAYRSFATPGVHQTAQVHLAKNLQPCSHRSLSFSCFSSSRPSQEKCTKNFEKRIGKFQTPSIYLLEWFRIGSPGFSRVFNLRFVVFPGRSIGKERNVQFVSSVHREREWIERVPPRFLFALTSMFAFSPLP